MSREWIEHGVGRCVKCGCEKEHGCACYVCGTAAHDTEKLAWLIGEIMSVGQHYWSRAEPPDFSLTYEPSDGKWRCVVDTADDRASGYSGDMTEAVEEAYYILSDMAEERPEWRAENQGHREE